MKHPRLSSVSTHLSMAATLPANVRRRTSSKSRETFNDSGLLVSGVVPTAWGSSSRWLRT